MTPPPCCAYCRPTEGRHVVLTGSTFWPGPTTLAEVRSARVGRHETATGATCIPAGPVRVVAVDQAAEVDPLPGFELTYMLTVQTIPARDAPNLSAGSTENSSQNRRAEHGTAR